MIKLNQSELYRRFALAGWAVALIFALQGGSCRSGNGGGTGGLPAADSKDYRAATRAFFVGVAALQAGDNNRAQKELEAASKLAPDEPAILADLALMALRGERLDEAAKQFDRALALAPNDSRILYLKALLDSRRGKFAEASAGFRKAAELDPKNLRARYALVEQVQQQGGADSDAEAQKLLGQIVEQYPGNLVAQLEMARLAAKRGDSQTLNAVVARLKSRRDQWPENVRQQLTALEAAASGPNPRAAATAVVFLQNVLKPVAQYRVDFAALKTPVGEVGIPLTRLVKLSNPTANLAPPDESLTFTASPADFGADKADAVCFIYLTQEAKPSFIAANGHTVRILGTNVKLPFPGGAGGAPPSTHGIVAADLNSDFKTDLALAGVGGLRLCRQGANGAFTDVTALAKIPAAITSAPLRGAWTADVDMDGDLDLILAPLKGPAIVLRNNGDGTFKPIQPFAGLTNLVDAEWADLDSDGDSDAVFLDGSGRLRVFVNERSGQFRESVLPAGFDSVAAFALLDANDDGVLDIAALKSDGSLTRLSDNGEGSGWVTAELGKWSGVTELKPESTRLLAADLDNNGGIDLLTSSTAASQAWLHVKGGVFKPLASPLPGKISSIADFNGDGRLDLAGVSADGKPVQLLNQGKKSYSWVAIGSHAAKAEGDQRNNTFGIGGSIEIRAGFLTQIQRIDAPVVHFGLGENAGADAARLIWPSGYMQAEFELKSNQMIAAQQRLKGSCPWIFAWNGKRIEFVTDFLWRSPLGLKINGQDTGRVAMTEDRVRIRGDQLVPRNGFYDIRITAELWETHFFDHVSLMAVDHPSGTEMHVDERFSIPPPSLDTRLTGPAHSVAHAWDDRGKEVTDLVAALDGKYLDTFGLGRYQGITRDHYVEVELGADAPTAGPLWLVAQGWIHPTDSSINVAISQGHHDPPKGLSLEVADGKGGWSVAKPNLGFPAGKTKTILVDINSLFKPGAPRKLRLRTNLEIYWDRLAWATGMPSAQVKTTRIQPETAELRYRGFSSINQASLSSPELPDYENLAGTAARWCDLVGYCTRFGDVKELLEKVDDRYVIMNAGDEMAFRFRALAPPPAGWIRDFVLVGDGWEKDGDLNTGFSKTVLPLPFHANPEYRTPPSTLQTDPVYKRYPQDWLNYHTRYVTPEPFWSALRVRDSQ